METQTGRPGPDPVPARNRLPLLWVVLPLSIVAVLAVGFGLRALL